MSFVNRRRRVLQDVWEDAEERRREEDDEGECSIPVTDIELWRKCFREQEALAREEAEEIRQHKEYRLQRAYERLQWEKEDVARNAAKEEKEKVMQREDVVKTARLPASLITGTTPTHICQPHGLQTSDTQLQHYPTHTHLTTNCQPHGLQHSTASLADYRNLTNNCIIMDYSQHTHLHHYLHLFQEIIKVIN